jgi:hypothetical protein
MKRIPLRDVAQGIIDALRAFHGDRYDVREVHQMARQVFTLAGGPSPSRRWHCAQSSPLQRKILYLWTETAYATYMFGLYERHAERRPAKPRVLDFGCGRLTRHSPVDARHKGVA